ncbi:MAG: phage terminase large subunit, partial [Dehalococcoidia bacterium]
TSYSAFLVVATDGRRFFVTDVVRAHLAYTDMRLVAEKLISDWHPNEILIEDAASGSALISDLRATGHVVQGVKPGTSNKVARLLRHLDVLKGQAVLVPEYAPWRAALVSELVGFPYAEHDDQVDALTQLIQFSKDNPQGPAHHIAVRDPFGAPVPVNAFGRRLQKGEHAMRPRRIGHRCPTARR